MLHFLQSKRGFTLVELVIVLLLLSLGAVALMNLVTAGWRTFQKSETRFAKQEAVKTAVELLQRGTKITAASSADIFNDLSIIPTPGSEADEDDPYSYLYTRYDADKGGYFIFFKNDEGIEQPLLDDSVSEPLHISIDAIRMSPYGEGEDEDSPLIFADDSKNENQSGVVIHVRAIEDSFDYGDDEDNPNSPTSDDVFYELNVGYHFPNMATSASKASVNFRGGKGEDNRSGANTYNDEGTIDGSVLSVDRGGTVLRVYVDSIIKGDTSSAKSTVPTFCFIASASYGQNSGEVGLLCDFRDNVLRGTALGDAFIKAYYTVSPPIAKLIQKSPALAAAVRAALKPLVLIATYALDRDLLAQNAVWLVTFGLCGLGSSAVLVGLSKRLRREKRHGQ